MSLMNDGQNCIPLWEKTCNYNIPPVIPIHAHWDVTTGCNFKCVFCLSSSGKRSPDELTSEDGFALIDKLYDAGIVFLKVLGGEPFFRKDMLDIFRYAAKKGMLLSFSTNASLVTEEIASTLAELKNSITYIQMSLYGENEERYMKVTGNNRNYSLALAGLQRMLDKGLDVTILTVATEENAESLSKYYAIANQKGVNEFRITPKLGVGRAAKEVNDGIYNEPMIWASMIAELKKIHESSKEYDTPVRIDARPLFGEYLFHLTGIPYFWQNCNSATMMIYINPTGKAAPCPFLTEMPEHLKKIYHTHVMGDIVKEPFETVWNSPSFQQFRDYYNPNKNLFTINTKCKFYRTGACTPCVVTPCNCTDMIRAVREECKNVRF